MKRKSLCWRLWGAPDQVRLRLLRLLSAAQGRPVPPETEDRRLLESAILPWFAERSQYRRVLFVGCDWYTHHYERFFAEREYWTLERDPRRRRFGGRRHVTDTVVNIGEHFVEESIDLVVLNGVLGWGLDTPDDAEAALGACASRLARGGVLILGWNDVPTLRVLHLDDSPALDALRAWPFPPSRTSRWLVAGRLRHTYDFYWKP